MTKNNQNFHCWYPLTNITKKKQKLSQLVSLAKKAHKSKTFTVGILGQIWPRKNNNFHHWYPWPKRLKKQKLSLLASLTKNDNKKKLSPLVSFAEKAHKSKTFTVGNLGQIWPRKTKTFTFGNLGQKWPRKNKNFQYWYPWPKRLKKQKFSPLVSLTKNGKKQPKTFTVGILGRKGSKNKKFHRW